MGWRFRVWLTGAWGWCDGDGAACGLLLLLPLRTLAGTTHASKVLHRLTQPTRACARRLESAVTAALDSGYRTGDIMQEGCTLVGCSAMGDVLLRHVAEPVSV